MRDSLLGYKEYYNTILNEITSAKYYGRSAYQNGDIKVAKYLIEKLHENGAIPLFKERGNHTQNRAYPPYKSMVKPGGEGRWSGERQFYKDYLQHFSYPLNVMRGNIKLSVDGKQMRPAVDFVAKEFSPSCKGRYKIAYLDKSCYTPQSFCKTLNSGEFNESFVVIDWPLFWEKLPFESHLERYFPYLEPLNNVGGIILKSSTPEQFPYFKARSYKVLNMPVLVVNSNFATDAKELTIDLDSRLIENKDGHNILALIEGEKVKDKYTLFVAHYDHLGLMGAENIYPGANDNGSGVAMVMALSKYYEINKPHNSAIFMLTDAEESNLLGSFYYVENSYIGLENIVDVIDIDMVADSGEQLLCQVTENLESGRDIMGELLEANSKLETPFKGIKKVELNDNSDNYPFVLKGVPSVYFEIIGDYNKFYHTPWDSIQNSTDENFERLFELIVRFAFA